LKVENNDKEFQKRITAIYLEILKREPGEKELQNQIEWMEKNNVSIKQLPHFFKNSPEYQQKKYELTLNSSENLLKHIGEFSFLLNPNDKTQVQIFSEDGKYEKGTVSVLKQLLKPGMTVLNIGANIGYFSVIISKIVGPAGRVFCFEPFPSTAELLKKNVKMNNCNNVEVFTKAISNKSGKDSMWIAPSSVNNFISKKGIPGLEKLDVDVTTVDDFVNEKNLQIDFIFMDAEGSERNAIEGMRNTIIDNKKLEIITEFNPYTFELAGTSGKEFLDVCSEFNFEFYIINENKATISPISHEKLLSIHYPQYENIYLKRSN